MNYNTQILVAPLLRIHIIHQLIIRISAKYHKKHPRFQDLLSQSYFRDRVMGVTVLMN